MTRDRRGVDHDIWAHRNPDAAADSKRDVLALYRAALTFDRQAMQIVIENTRCVGCLAAGAAQLGLWLTMGDGDHAEQGGYTPEFQADVMRALEWLQDCTDDAPPEDDGSDRA